MNTERLLGHYETIAEAPGAVASLRRFILDLAVQGKLVPQEPSDEPASELLKRVAAERKRLIGEARVRETPVADSRARVEIGVPAGWVRVPGVTIFATQSGNSKLIKGKLHPSPSDGLYPGFSAAGQDVWLSHWEHEGEAIILSAVGARCGKAFLAHGKWSAVANTHIIWLLPKIIYPRFALLCLNNEALWIRSGGAQPFVKVRETLERPFALPPLSEQHRIVAKVDELMTLCDQLEEARARREATRDRLTAASLGRLDAPDPATYQKDVRFALDALPILTTRADQIKPLRQTILNLAVRGKLVPQDPNDEPASDLLKRIANKAVDIGKRQNTNLTSQIDLNAAPFELPAGWTWTCFPELGTFGRGKSKHRPRNDPALYSGGTHLMVQTGDVARSGGLITTYTNKYNDAGLAQSQKWPKGTLCITIAANIADSGILDFDACFPDSVVGFVPAPIFENARYFEYFVRTAKADLLEFAPATAQKNINLEILRSVLIPLPPLAEQHRIVAKVDELMTLFHRLEAGLTTADKNRRRLLEALLAEALATTEAQVTEAAA